MAAALGVQREEEGAQAFAVEPAVVGKVVHLGRREVGGLALAVKALGQARGGEERRHGGFLGIAPPAPPQEEAEKEGEEAGSGAQAREQSVLFRPVERRLGHGPLGEGGADGEVMSLPDGRLGREDEAGFVAALCFGEVHRRIRRAGTAEKGQPVGERRALSRHDGAGGRKHSALPACAGDVPAYAVFLGGEAGHARHLVDKLEGVHAGSKPGLLVAQVDGDILGAEVGLEIVRSAGLAVDGGLEDMQEGSFRHAGRPAGGHRQGAEDAVVAVALGDPHLNEFRDLDGVLPCKLKGDVHGMDLDRLVVALGAIFSEA